MSLCKDLNCLSLLSLASALNWVPATEVSKALKVKLSTANILPDGIPRPHHLVIFSRETWDFGITVVYN
jgi:hypothetical protein